MLRKTLAALAIATAFGSAQATVITFEDAPGARQNSYLPIGPGYKGYTFSCHQCGENRLDVIDTVNSSWNLGAVSGDFTMLNNYGGNGIVRAADGSDFSFDGLWARTWYDAAPRGVSIVGLNNGQTVWTQNGTLTSSWAQFAGMNGAVDELRLNLGNWFLVDNLALNERGTVPEPTSLLLAGLGLAALGAARRSRAKV